jgi:hypothetical protein
VKKYEDNDWEDAEMKMLAVTAALAMTSAGWKTLMMTTMMKCPSW